MGILKASKFPHFHVFHKTPKTSCTTPFRMFLFHRPYQTFDNRAIYTHIPRYTIRTTLSLLFFSANVGDRSKLTRACTERHEQKFNWKIVKLLQTLKLFLSFLFFTLFPFLFTFPVQTHIERYGPFRQGHRNNLTANLKNRRQILHLYILSAIFEFSSTNSSFCRQIRQNIDCTAPPP